MRGDRALEALLNPQERPEQSRAELAAAFNAVPALLLGALGLRLATAPGGIGASEAAAWFAALIALFLVSVPALAVLQADVRCNPELSSESRVRWLALLVTLPGAGVVYRLRHLRP